MTENYNPDIIIANIDSLCNQHGISINKMLSECKLNKSIVDNIKKGSVPSVDKLQKISNYFKCGIDYLLGNEVTRTVPTDDDLKFALFNGTEGVTDEMYDEVKQFAEMVKMRENAKRKENK